MSPDLGPYERAIEYVLQTNASTEARAWVEDQSKGPRVLWEFSADESKYIIGNAYARGAVEVFAIGDEDAINEYGSVDMLLLRLPDDADSRQQLFELENAVAEEHGFSGAIDEGMRDLLLRWT